MSTIEPRRSGAVRTLDRALVLAGVIGGVLIILWAVSAVGHLILFAFKVAILVIVVALIVRLVHALTRKR
jgi:hypothetical protein